MFRARTTSTTLPYCRDWCMLDWHDLGRREGFRTEKDDIDQEAEAVPDPPPPRGKQPGS